MGIKRKHTIDVLVCQLFSLTPILLLFNKLQALIFKSLEMAGFLLAYECIISRTHVTEFISIHVLRVLTGN